MRLIACESHVTPDMDKPLLPVDITPLKAQSLSSAPAGQHQQRHQATILRLQLTQICEDVLEFLHGDRLAFLLPGGRYHQLAASRGVMLHEAILNGVLEHLAHEVQHELERLAGQVAALVEELLHVRRGDIRQLHTAKGRCQMRRHHAAISPQCVCGDSLSSQAQTPYSPSARAVILPA